MDIKAKYSGLQTALKVNTEAISHIGDYGCLFLALCSIAEEFNESYHTGKRLDIIAFYLKCKKNGWVNEEFFCKDQTSILKEATGKNWKKEIQKKLPAIIPDEMYTIEKWYNPKTTFTHFKRRGFDTLESSNTVKNGRLEGYYCYTCDIKSF